MAKQREKNGSPAVPQFGAWDQKTGDNLNYSMVFSQARANKKQNKTSLLHNSLGNEQEILGKHQEVSPRKNSQMAVPQYGAWDNPDNSTLPPKARANKQHKHVHSWGNDREILAKKQQVSTMTRPKSVPQFAELDQKTEGSPDYAKVSPQARANKQHKQDVARRGLGNEQEHGKHQEVLRRKDTPMPVPQLGAWDQKTGDDQAQVKKKQHKHHSLGNEHEHGKHQDVSPMKTGWLSVPQFGEWDQKTVSETNYSVVFSQARANRKHHKSDLTHRSYDFEQELLCRERERAATRKKKKLLSYLTCCLPV